MQRPVLILLLLITLSLMLTGFVLREDALRGQEDSRSALAVLLGDGRRLFANHFLAKADAYFHRGRYPSVFEMAERERGNHLVDSLTDDHASSEHVHGHDGDHDHEIGHVHGHDGDHDHEIGHVHGHDGDHNHEVGHEAEESCEHAQPAKRPTDWIARLARGISPDVHEHLEGGKEREMLPWVQLAVEMDPHNVDAYVVGGYWLVRMGKMEEAQAFLREGQRNNPDSHEIYFELGRFREQDESQWPTATRLYVLALDKWKQAAEGVEHPDLLALGQILGPLGRIEEKQGELEAALHYYGFLKTVSPRPEAVQRLIDSVQARLGEKSPAPPSL
jgi:tetratricopeptide (TPR) repeat protein